MRNSSSVNFIGGNTDLSQHRSPTSAAEYPEWHPIRRHWWAVCVTSGTISGPAGTDFATYTGGPDGVAIIPLPASDYVTSLAAVPPGSTNANVKLPAGDTETFISKTVNALLLGPGVVLTPQDATTTLTVASGVLVFAGNDSRIGARFPDREARDIFFFSSACILYTTAGTTTPINSIITSPANTPTR